jgi:hypothetical protein
MGGNQLASSEVTLKNSDAGSDMDCNGVYGGAIPAPAVGSTVKLVHWQTGPVAGVSMRRGESSGSGSSYIPRVSSDRSLQNGKVKQNEEQRRQKCEDDSEAGMLHAKSPQLSWPMTLLLLVAVTIVHAVILSAATHLILDILTLVSGCHC